MRTKERKPKKGFCDGYKTYDTSNGYGNKQKWQRIFDERIGREAAEEELKEESPYTVLGVSVSSTQDEIRSAFRTLIQKWHPDISTDPRATEMSKKIIAAYSLLKK